MKSKWERLNQKAISFLQAGRLQEALEPALAALALAERSKGEEHLRVALSLNNLGELYHAKGELDRRFEPVLNCCLGKRPRNESIAAMNFHGDRHGDKNPNGSTHCV